jgi:hypothetical protein
MEEFGAAREQLYRKVEAHTTSFFLMTALAGTDIAPGRNEARSVQKGSDP